MLLGGGVASRLFLRGGLLLLAAVLVLACPSLGCAAEPITLSSGRLGDVRVFPPAGEPSRFVVLFSGPSGWGPAEQQGTDRLSHQGVAVAAVDLPVVTERLRHGREGDETCIYLVSDIEELSRQAERRLGFSTFRAPILAGAGPAGTLAYLALAQAPPATIAGAISAGFTPLFASALPFCAGAPAEPAGAGRFRYHPRRSLPGWWRLALSAPPAPPLRDFVAASEDAAVLTITSGDDWASIISAAIATVPDKTDRPAALEHLPLVELPADRPGPMMAVIYSGDGGWRDLDKQIGEWLSAHGVPVIGIDSLRYFWTRKTPEQMANDLDAIIDLYGERWQRSDVLLIGYSFGADILPFAVNALPAETRARVVQISLLGLSQTADFEFHVSGWFGGESEDKVPVLPAFKTLDQSLVQCVYGKEEDDTSCTSPELDHVERIRTDGGHHFDGDYVALARKILDGANWRRAQRLSAPATE